MRLSGDDTKINSVGRYEKKGQHQAEKAPYSQSLRGFSIEQWGGSGSWRHKTGGMISEQTLGFGADYKPEVVWLLQVCPIWKVLVWHSEISFIGN